MNRKRKPLKERIEILYEDQDVIVVNKASGIMSQPMKDEEGDSVVELIRYYWKTRSKKSGFIGVVHRLDKETSGVMVLARNKVAHRLLSVQFKNHSVYKRYLAVVDGVPKCRRKQLIGYQTRDFTGKRAVSLDPEKGKQMVTRYVVVESIGNRSLLELVIETGRTHQIRLQLAKLGCPVLGEIVYSKDKKRVQGFERCALHSSRLVFQHPATGKKVTFDAPLPEDMQKLIMPEKPKKEEMP